MSHQRNQSQGMRWRPKEEIASSKKVIDADAASQNGFSVANSKPRALSASSPEFRPLVKGSTSREAATVKKLNFVSYLPQDDGGVHVEEAQEVVGLLNKELSALLKLKPAEFWGEVASNQSLHGLLESYLLFRRRWYDLSAKTDIVGGEDELSRRIFMVLLRMSTEQEPGTPAGTLGILREKEVFTVSRIMDICAIYGHHNAELTGRLVRDVFRLQPECLQDVSVTVSKVSNTMHTVYERSIKMMNSSSKTNQKLQNELAEVVEFLYDTVMTLDTFLEIFPPAATMLLSSDSSGDKSLLSAVGSVHDVLLPSLRKQFTWETLVSLQNGLVKFVWTLIRYVFFEDVKVEGPRLDPSVAGQRFVQALITLSSGSDESEISILFNVANRFDLSQNIQRLLQTGSIILDDSLYAHMLALLPEATLSNVLQESGKPPTEADVQDTEHEAVWRSYISQIKDLFPSYGDGYISACLEVYDNNPEVVIQHILEGTLHPDLATLDVTMPAAEKPVQASKDKGKGKLEDKGKGKLEEKGKGKLVDEQPQQKHMDSRQGRFMRRSKDADEDAVKLLNEKDAGSSSRTARLAMQILYDDEYDDSFDDLDANVNIAGIETDNLVNLISKRKQESVSDAGDNNRVSSSNQKPKDKRRESPLFYVKDGKHYSYKVAGSVPVASLEEAEALKRQEEELIYGLGPGGNVPLDNNGGNDNETEQEEAEDDEQLDPKQQQHHTRGGRSNYGGYGRGQGRGRGKPTKQYYVSKSHNKKDLAMKKHSSALR